MKRNIGVIVLVLCILVSVIEINAEVTINELKVTEPEKCSISKSSLEIEIENIDLSSFVDERNLSQYELDELEENNSKLLKNKDVTKNDFKKEKKTWYLDEITQTNMKEVYKELEFVDLSKWTYGDMDEFSFARDIYKYLTNDEINELGNRGITKQDSLTLIKEYGSFESIMDTTDDELINFLTNEYKGKIKYVNSKNKKAKNDNKSKIGKIIGNIIIEAAAYEADMDYYEAAYVPIYGADIFHIRTMTEVRNNKYVAAAATQKLWDVIYRPGTIGVNVQATFSAANLWGTYSESKGSAHEGIDFNAKPTERSKLHAVMASNRKGKKVTAKNLNGANLSTTFAYEIVSETGGQVSNGYTVFYMHSNTWTSTSSFINGYPVAKESDEGTDNIHNHFSVNKGYNNVPGFYEKSYAVPILTSDNIYTFANDHTYGTYTWYYGN